MRKWIAGVAGLVAVSTAGAYWKLTKEVPAYEVIRVIDGDTFETREKQLIRLAEIDAPEPELCGGTEAKKYLTELVTGKPVYLKVMYRDSFMRLIAYVYTPEGFVNEKMVRKGLAIYRLKWQKNAQSEKLAAALEKAESDRSGIFGEKCTQIKNSQQPKCNIKGNAREGESTRIYLLPGCSAYNRTVIQLYLGDQWFCSESEAKKAGFVKAGGC
jgi:micrococcal nuclease